MLVDKLLKDPNDNGIVKKPTHKQSLFKAITWRIIGSLDTIFISYMLTGTLKIAAAIGGIEIFSKMILYYIHERVWIFFGRKALKTKM